MTKAHPPALFNTVRRPVFVDSSGRRRRAVLVLGSGLGVLLVTGLVMLLAGLFTGSPGQLPGWPDAAHPEPAATPAQEPEPAPTSATPQQRPTATPTTAPATTPPGNGNGNGNGHGRPSKTPGKP